MIEGLKLYRQFNELVKQAGSIKLVWFTTFNLEVSFFERYILSAIAGRDPKQVKTVNDYEALNETLFGTDDSDSAIDIRVFYDYRALGIKEVKKTSVNIIGINPENLRSKFKGGVFHPKVCLLVNQENEAFVLTGSANLTISGWGRNKESIIIRKIDDLENARRITTFFSELCDTSGRRTLNRLLRDWENKLDPNSDWEFHHSFMKESFTAKIGFEGASLLALSPYFSDNLDLLCDQHFKEAARIHIVPDHYANGQIRMGVDTLERLREIDRVDIFRIGAKSSDDETFIHAKLWLTPNRLAVGSWNFSGAAIGIGRSGNNVEAGIIQNINREEHQRIMDSFSLVGFGDHCYGQTSEDIHADRETTLNPWKLNCTIEADWKTYLFSLQINEVITAGEFFIELPGVQGKIDLKIFKDRPVSFHKDATSVLRNRIFTVYDTGGERIFMGIIAELNVPDRPAMGFDHISDFIRGWIDGQPEVKKDLQKVVYITEEETGEEINEYAKKRMKGDYEKAWFSMFLAMERMKSRLSAARNQVELMRIGYKIPGSFSQLKSHLERIKGEQNDDDSYSEPYVWFLINEGNNIIRNFNNQLGDLKDEHMHPAIELVKNISIQFDNRKKGEKWLKFIEMECSYEHV